jgi:hypothetical protein
MPVSKADQYCDPASTPDLLCMHIVRGRQHYRGYPLQEETTFAASQGCLQAIMDSNCVNADSTSAEMRSATETPLRRMSNSRITHDPGEGFARRERSSKTGSRAHFQSGKFSTPSGSAEKRDLTMFREFLSVSHEHPATRRSLPTMTRDKRKGSGSETGQEVGGSVVLLCCLEFLRGDLNDAGTRW